MNNSEAFTFTDLIKLDNQFTNAASNNVDIQNQNINTNVANISTRSIQEIQTPNNKLFSTVNISEDFRVDLSPIIQRPFYADTVQFNTSAPRYSMLNSQIKFLPGDLIRSNDTILNAMKTAALGRPDTILNISMAGTISHAGCVLAAILPPLPKFFDQPTPNIINSMLSSPHAFLFANEATSVSLPVPFYCNTDLATLDMQIQSSDPTLDITQNNGNYATLAMLVLNPLTPSAGASTNLNIVIEACFTKFDMYVPTPRYIQWSAQVGYVNPAYEDYNPAIHDALNKTLTSMLSLHEKAPSNKKARIMQAMSLLVGCFSIASVGRHLHDLLEPAEFCGTLDMMPQSGLVTSLTKGVSGLLDLTASGIKTVTGDAIDSARSWLTSMTGLHNPNFPFPTQRIVTNTLNFPNYVDSSQFMEKLDPHARNDRVLKQALFNTDIDEQSFKHITNKDQLIGTISIKDTDTVGTLKWVRPISPFQGGISTSDKGIVSANNIELLHSMHRAWSGKLKIKIQSVMNNKQQVKLRVLKYYNPSAYAINSYPVYSTIVNAPSHLMEFTQGGQVMEVELPYLCRNSITPCCENTDVEALFHGLYYIYVAQALATADGSPNSIEFNIYMSSDDLTFYGYANKNITPIDYGIYSILNNNPSMFNYKTLQAIYDKYITLDLNYQLKDGVITHGMDYVKTLMDRYSLPLEFFTNTDNLKFEEIGYPTIVTHIKYKPIKNKFERKNHSFGDKWEPQVGNSITVMNEPQTQEQQMMSDGGCSMSESDRLLPNVDIRPLVRRMYKTAAQNSVLSSGASVNYAIPLNTIVGESPYVDLISPVNVLSRMYYGKSLGFKIRLVFNITKSDSATFDSSLLRVYYIPQNINFTYNSKTIVSAIPHTTNFPALNDVAQYGVPFTFQLRPVQSNPAQAVFEFTTPDTSYYKYLGSPNKFYTAATLPAQTPELSTADFGTILVQMSNIDTKDLISNFEFMVGLTDESRMGFHSLAPTFIQDKNTANYVGTDTDPYAQIPNTLNPYVYKGGFM